MNAYNMEKIRENFEDKLNKISYIHAFAQEVYLYTDYFHNPHTKDEIDLIVNSIHSSHLQTIMHIMFRTLINEVSKLYSYSQNDRFRLKAFVDSLSPSGYYGKLCVPENYINEWKRKFEENTEIIKNILLLRNQVYAHSDNFFNDPKEIDITFRKIKCLLDLADDIVKKVYLLVFDIGYESDSPNFNRDRFILLKLLSEAEKHRQNELTRNALKMIEEMHQK